MWVMIELGNVSIHRSLLLHKGVNSWFQILQPAVHDFTSEERVVWIDIEGVPLSVWSRETFTKIGKKWGEVMDIEESSFSTFARKRLCVKTILEDNILEKFKVVFKGKVFLVRAKELFAWTPTFVEYKEMEYISDDEGLVNSVQQSVGSEHANVDQFDSDEEGVPDTNFGENIVSPIKSVNQSSGKEGEPVSEDPFGIYEVLNRNLNQVTKELDPSLSHPPGFTPVESQQEETNGESNNIGFDKELPKSAVPNVVNNSEVPANESGNGDFPSLNFAKGGSFLDVLDGMVRVGQSMGYEMDGCIKDLENIIGNNGDSVFPK
ncbi:hypothetical protein Tco_1468913 [Tanacetum coccineum]